MSNVLQFGAPALSTCRARFFRTHKLQMGHVITWPGIDCFSDNKRPLQTATTARGWWAWWPGIDLEPHQFDEGA